MFGNLLCILALTWVFPPNSSASYVEKIGASYSERLAICTEIATSADLHGVSQSLAVAVGFTESKFTYSTSGAGAVGPLQVIRKYVCRTDQKNGAECDLIDAGVQALRYWVKRSSTVARGLCRYNAGNTCTTTGRKYARGVLSRQRVLDAQMRLLFGQAYKETEKRKAPRD